MDPMTTETAEMFLRQRDEAVKAAAELARALRWTQEYFGDEMLPPIPGWSWFDALQKHGHYEDTLDA